MKNTSKITDAELEILKVLWSKNKPVSCAEIYNELKDNMYWENTTVRTLVSRLKEKGILQQEKKDIYYYYPLISEKDYTNYQTKKLLNKFYKGSAKNLIASLFEDKYISDDEIKELKKFWENIDNK